MDELHLVLEIFERAARRVYTTRELKWRAVGSAYYHRAAITALMVRQYRLFLYFVRSPSYWDMLLAPTLLRMMVENLITVAWICRDLDTRCAMYIDYGLGQARLFGENLNKFIEDEGGDETLERLAKAQLAWVESQKMLHFVDINLGSWADTDLRSMAKEVGMEEIHKFGFSVFSAAVHGTWNHTGMNDVRPCANSLHKFHLIARPIENFLSEDFLYRACKFFDLFFDCVDAQLADAKRKRSLRHLYEQNEEKIFGILQSIFSSSRAA